MSPNGFVHCWGSNSNGQLGDDSRMGSLVPVTVPGISTAAAISGRWASTCALLLNGSVQCWGVNDLGQLGNGSTANSQTPTLVTGLSSATAISVGSQHACALVTGGGILCWGSNSSGQLGNNSTTDSSVPVSVSGVSTAIAVSVAGLHSCALLADGSIQCWGSNSSGQLGNNTIVSSRVPVTVSGISTATAISTGSNYSCARLSSGSIQCWGSNSSGQLGNNTFVNSSVPVTVSGISTATAISAGHNHSCASLSGGSIRCWGSNSSGQLGNNTFVNSSVPVTVSGISTAAGSSAGLNHSCARLSSGSIRCWGSNSSGQLGNNSTIDRMTQVRVMDLGHALTYSLREATVGKHLLIRTTASNSLAQVVKFSASTQAVTSAPRLLLSPVVSGTRTAGSELRVSEGTWASYPEPLTSYQWFRCSSQLPSVSIRLPSQCTEILGATGSTYTLSSLDYGAYITASTTKQNLIGDSSVWSVATSVTNQAPELETPPALSYSYTSSSVTLTINQGSWLGIPAPTFSYQTFVCSEEVSNVSEELDQGCEPLSGTFTNSAFTLSGESWTETLGKHILVKVTATNLVGDKSVYTASSPAISSQPRATQAPAITGLRQVGGVLTVSAGTWVGHPLPLTQPTYQWVRCDEANFFSAASNCNSIEGATSSSYTQTFADAGKFIAATVTRTNDIGSGVALTSSPTVTNAMPSLLVSPSLSGDISLGSQVTVSQGSWQGFPAPTFSFNWFECDTQTTESSNALPDNCEEVSGSVDSIVSGSSHDCVLTSKGVVECWGNNSNGQIGDGTRSQRTSPTRVNSLQGVVSISGTLQHTCALLSTGMVHCWGAGGEGRLGNGSLSDRLTPTLVSNLDSALEVSAGHFHSCALTTSGEVRCWGEGASGRLGDGSTIDKSTPSSVFGIDSAVSIAAGGSHSCAVLSDGAVWCWGSNSHGQLGDGTFSNKSRPVRVLGIDSASVVSAGSLHTCALLTTGEVWCWGAGMYWQGVDWRGCAMYSACNDQPSATPREIGSLDVSVRPTGIVSLDATSVSAGDGHSCASLKSGGVRCWGRGVSGQLGEGSTIDRLHSQSTVTGITSAASALAGRSQSCAILRDGSVSCWGSLQTGISLVPSPNLSYPGNRRARLMVQGEHAGKYLIAKVTSKNSIGTAHIFSASTTIIR